MGWETLTCAWVIRLTRRPLSFNSLSTELRRARSAQVGALHFALSSESFQLRSKQVTKSNTKSSISHQPTSDKH